MDAYIGEIRAFPYMYVPENWLACNGQQLYVAQYQALYSIIGNLYGGNSTQFNLPNLQGSVLQGIAAGVRQLLKGGEETVTLNLSQIPYHNHTVNGFNHTVAQNPSAVSSPSPTTYITNGVSVGAGKGIEGFSAASNGTIMNANTVGVSPAAPAVAHENRMPYLAFSYCICVAGGEYPPRP